MLQDFTRSPPYFSQILKPDLDDKNFPRDYLIYYVEDLFLCSPFQASL